MNDQPKPDPKRPEPLTEHSIDFAYTIYWTKQARTWEAARRRDLSIKLAALLESPDFLNNAFERKYVLAGLDEQAHAGASLTALKKVLDAFDH